MTAPPYTIPAKPTVYRGVQMRSGNEARCAQALEAAGLPWTYEPKSFPGPDGTYTPDFATVISRRLVYVEAKPYGWPLKWALTAAGVIHAHEINSSFLLMSPVESSPAWDCLMVGHDFVRTGWLYGQTLHRSPYLLDRRWVAVAAAAAAA
jgi:hypothetical protein